jgi:transposase
MTNLMSFNRSVVDIEDGKLEIDNNLVENAIRPCALDKRNHLFIGHPSDGHRAAHFYSLIGTCLLSAQHRWFSPFGP